MQTLHILYSLYKILPLNDFINFDVLFLAAFDFHFFA
jgi:hypothetical protein